MLTRMILITRMGHHAAVAAAIGGIRTLALADSRPAPGAQVGTRPLVSDCIRLMAGQRVAQFRPRELMRISYKTTMTTMSIVRRHRFATSQLSELLFGTIRLKCVRASNLVTF